MSARQSEVVATAFGRRLREVRVAARVSQEQLGKFSGLHRTEIGMLERGVRVPRLDTILKLAGGLNVEPETLMPRIVWESQSARRRGAFFHS
jgi:transcriptional regulator with XRE-family HTH domain